MKYDNTSSKIEPTEILFSNIKEKEKESRHTHIISDKVQSVEIYNYETLPVFRSCNKTFIMFNSRKEKYSSIQEIF